MKGPGICRARSVQPLPTGFDLIGSNGALQEHWVRRVIAIVVDAILVSFVVWLISFPFGPGFWAFWPAWNFLHGIIWLFYAVFFDMASGGTLGKKILSLRVVALDGNLDAAKALIRNISKVFWVLLLLDTLLGLATPGDPRQRYLDRISRTTVTRVDQQAYMEEQFRMMQHVPQMPPPGYAPAGAPPPVPPVAGAPPAQPPAQGAWPGQTPQPSGWPQHQWNQEGQLMPARNFCTACGGQLVARGDGKLTCVRCGTVY